MPSSSEWPTNIGCALRASEIQSGLLMVALAGTALLSWSGDAAATPAYGRRYGVACATCHAPLPPRLNNVGILFRRLGFRLPDADDQGRFIIKTAPAHDIGDAASIVADVAGRRDNEVEAGEARTTFELQEVELVAGTAVGDHVSGQAMFVPWDEGEVELENAELQYNVGSPRHQWFARGGLLQTYAWQKPTHGRLTLATPLLFGPRAVQGVGAFDGFGLGVAQIGAEVGYLFSRLTNGRLGTTLLTAAVLNGVTDEGEGALRNTAGGADLYLQGLQLFGARNTIGGFYYRGRTAVFADSEDGATESGTHRFARYGAIGNYLLGERLDFVAGAALGRDQAPLGGLDVPFSAFFGELDVQIVPSCVAVYRYDRADPDRDSPSDGVRAHTVSTTFRADDHLYLTGEYQRRRSGDGDTPWAVIVNARFVF
ncbi:MAG: hypothetical protein AB7I50_09900 [Vicinamibacterales bacterium]